MRLTGFIIFLLFCYPYNTQVITNSSTKVQKLNLQKKINSNQKKGEYITANYSEEWETDETAIIICDMWDKHWCAGASERTAEMAPLMNVVVLNARNLGNLIVHAPGGCMEFYKDHPARERAQKYVKSKHKVNVNTLKLPPEKNAKWPIDDSDGGCDCSPECKQSHPWTRQIDVIQIKENALITDSGEELISYLQNTGIKNVILMGVHTNMCIIHRPYGLRSMINAGFNTVLMRDMTDSMYDSKQWPNVSHCEGTRLMIDYIEKYICPTVLSSEFTKTSRFHFKDDPKY